LNVQNSGTGQIQDQQNEFFNDHAESYSVLKFYFYTKTKPMNRDSCEEASYLEPKNESISPALDNINENANKLLEQLTLMKRLINRSNLEQLSEILIKFIQKLQYKIQRIRLVSPATIIGNMLGSDLIGLP
jgi:hypothetical protein